MKKQTNFVIGVLITGVLIGYGIAKFTLKSPSLTKTSTANGEVVHSISTNNRVELVKPKLFEIRPESQRMIQRLNQEQLNHPIIKHHQPPDSD